MANKIIKNVLATCVLMCTLIMYVRIIVIVVNMCEIYAIKYVDYLDN